MGMRNLQRIHPVMKCSRGDVTTLSDFTQRCNRLAPGETTNTTTITGEVMYIQGVNKTRSWYELGDSKTTIKILTMSPKYIGTAMYIGNPVSCQALGRKTPRGKPQIKLLTVK